MKISFNHVNSQSYHSCAGTQDLAEAYTDTALTRLPVSVFIIAKDEEDRLPFTLDSVKGWASEIIVIVDDTTTDATSERAALHGAKVYHRSWDGFGAQKRFGESKCTFPWILNLDADEALSPALQEELCLYFVKHDMDPPKDGFRLDIRIVRRGEHYIRWFAPSNDPVRLYRKASASFRDNTVHDSVVFHIKRPRIGRFIAPVLHRSFRSYRHAVEKINYYSDLQAQEMFDRGKNFSRLRILVEPFFAFFKAFIIRRYMFLGFDGFIESWIYVFSRMIRIGKLREKIRKERRP